MELNTNIKAGAPDVEYLPHEEYDVAHQRGKERVKGNAVDTKILAEPITFHFSKRTAPNRFLKAPMTERLCHWNEVGVPGEDIVRFNESSPPFPISPQFVLQGLLPSFMSCIFQVFMLCILAKNVHLYSTNSAG